MGKIIDFAKSIKGKVEAALQSRLDKKLINVLDEMIEQLTQLKEKIDNLDEVDLDNLEEAKDIIEEVANLYD